MEFLQGLLISVCAGVIVLIGDYFFQYIKNKKENLIKIKNAFSSLRIKVSFFVKDMTKEENGNDICDFELNEETLKNYDDLLPYIFQIKYVLSEGYKTKKEISKILSKYCDDLLKLLEKIRNTRVYGTSINIEEITNVFDMETVNKISKMLNIEEPFN